MAEVKILVDVWHQIVDGRRVRRSKGDIVDISDEDQCQWLVSAGIATQDTGGAASVSDASAKAPAASNAPAKAKPNPVEKPLNTQARAAWDKYARAVGVDPTKFKTKADLQAALN